MSGLKRIASVPQEAHGLAGIVSKADLLEAAWALAGLCNDGDGCEDNDATLRRLHEELCAQRVARGEKPLPPLDTLRAKREEQARQREADRAESRTRWLAKNAPR